MKKLEKVKKILEETGKYWIGFVGDSITSCEWVHPNWREIVEYALKEEFQPKFADWRVPSWGIRCFNYGFDGSTTKDILNLISNDKFLISNLDLVISLMGGNDRLFGITPDQTKTNVEEIIRKLDEKDIGVVWCTSTPAHNLVNKNKEYEPYVKATMAVEKSTRVQLINMFEKYKQFDLDRFFTFKSEENPEEGVKEGDLDFWHPNQLGNAYIAKVILKEVFGVEFDPEKYIKENLAGEKYPGY